MSTFVTTSLLNRTDDSNVQFEPRTISNGVGMLLVPSALAGFGDTMKVASRRAGAMRFTSLHFQVPLFSDDDRYVIRYCQAKLDLAVPDGMPHTHVNNLVGYVHEATDSAQANVDQLLVGGVGVY